MKETKAFALIAASLLWFFGFASCVYTKGSPLSGIAELIVKGAPRDLPYRTLLFPAFIFSLLPAVIFLGAVGVVLIVPAPK